MKEKMSFEQPPKKKSEERFDSWVKNTVGDSKKSIELMKKMLENFKRLGKEGFLEVEWMEHKFEELDGFTRDPDSYPDIYVRAFRGFINEKEVEAYMQEDGDKRSLQLDGKLVKDPETVDKFFKVYSSIAYDWRGAHREESEDVEDEDLSNIKEALF